MWAKNAILHALYLTGSLSSAPQFSREKRKKDFYRRSTKAICANMEYEKVAMTRIEAERLLGIAAGADAKQIRAAWAAAVRTAHPDTGTETPGNYIGLLTQARDILSGPANSACVRCGGSGMVRGAFGMRPCSACGGEGDEK